MPRFSGRIHIWPWRWQLTGIIVAMTLMPALLPAAVQPPTDVLQTLDVSLDPAMQRLDGRYIITLPAASRNDLIFYLNPNAKITSVTAQDQPLSFEFKGDSLRITLPVEGSTTGRSIDVAVTYRAVFADPVPAMPINTDNPGYGVTGTIGSSGAFLLGGAGWYPVVQGMETSAMRVVVDGPEGWIAVTAGRSLGRETSDGRTRSTWVINTPTRGLHLSASTYVVTEKTDGDITVATYFLPDSQHLAESYIEAAIDFIRFYQDRFGPYPFPKFAVVENFFPTGYGFPSYTVMGSRVLRLPFIRYTSLGHEIAHCWWGNGVYVDYRRGNWSEALTTYVADYLYKERAGAKEARAYRVQAMRNYAALVTPERDFPLSAFTSRSDRVTKVIGYDKGAMVFHMLRQRLGEKTFWASLKRLYREKLFKDASWSDLQAVFQEESGLPLARFFAQWVGLEGAPAFRLKNISVSQAADGYAVNGWIEQTQRPFDVLMDMTLYTEAEVIRQSIPASGARTPFRYVVNDPPGKLILDPDANIFRLLETAEIPPTINSIKASENLLVVLAEAWAGEHAVITQRLLQSFGISHAQIIDERRLSDVGMVGRDVLFIGVPDKRDLLHILPETIELYPEWFGVNGEIFNESGDALFCVFQHPVSDGRIAGLFFPVAPEAAMRALPKITHYGKYSYLVFRQGRNRVKSTWQVNYSPMIHHFPPGEITRGAPHD